MHVITMIAFLQSSFRSCDLALLALHVQEVVFLDLASLLHSPGFMMGSERDG